MKQVLGLEKYGWMVKKEDAFPFMTESAIDSVSGFLEALAAEYRAKGTILGHRRDGLFRSSREAASDCYGRQCALPAGPAACPLVMGARGVAAAYLCGARAFELPVQASITAAMARPKPPRRPAAEDQSPPPRPSMRVLRETSLSRLYLLVLSRLLALDPDSCPGESFLFTANLSVEGNAETEDFLSSLNDGRALETRAALLRDFRALLSGPDPFAGTDLAGRLSRLSDIESRMQNGPVSALTIALPDGLPLKEAEPELMSLISGSGFPIELKLGPWVLGSERLSDVFRRIGVERDPQSFGRNAATRYSQAIMTIRRLFTLARERSSFFGIRIDGSLPAAIGRSLSAPEGPGVQGFLSGPRVFAAGLSLAARISEDLSGTLPLSFSGGLDPERAAFLFKAGLRPLNLATALYSPEGFSALRPLAEAIDAIGAKAPGLRDHAQIDVRALRDCASSLLG